MVRAFRSRCRYTTITDIANRHFRLTGLRNGVVYGFSVRLRVFTGGAIDGEPLWGSPDQKYRHAYEIMKGISINHPKGVRYDTVQSAVIMCGNEVRPVRDAT